jgi:C4-dicarboxylate transporter DctQ subunit
MIKSIDQILRKIEENAIAILLMLMTFITFWQVINRFILKEPLHWSEELSRYLSIWAAFIGASLGVKKGAHIGVEAFVAILPKTIQRYVYIITTVFCFIFCGAIAYIGYGYCIKLISTGQLSPAMRIPIVLAYAAVPVGCFMMALRYVLLLIQEIANYKKEIKEGECN